MRVVDPGTQRTGARHAATVGAERWLPNSRKLIEAGFALILGVVGLFGFDSTFDARFYLAVGAIGLALGIVIAHVVSALKWHWTLGLVGAVAAYFVFGGAVAVRHDLIARIIPTVPTLQDMATTAVYGWKDLLTTLPPVSAQGSFLALPFLLGLVFGAAMYGLARGVQAVAAPHSPAVILFALVIALGTDTLTLPVIQTLVWAGVGFAWLAYRSYWRGRLAQAGTGTRGLRLVTGIGMVVVALAAGVFAGPHLPGLNPARDILRHHVLPPKLQTEYVSPLPGFRRYSSSVLYKENQGLGEANPYFYGATVMTVEGAAPGTLIRIAVLDSYDGRVWGAQTSRFRTVGSVIGAGVAGEPQTLTITTGPGYVPLNVWVPSLGYATSVTFTGTTAKAHADNLVYDTTTGQGLVLNQLQTGEKFTVTSIPVPVVDLDTARSPSGAPLVGDPRTDFMSTALAAIAGGNVDTWEQLTSVAKSLVDGGWSDGTRAPGEAQYTPGDGQDRLTAFLATRPAYAGSDEQYAATFALAANRLGFPARVVFGARMPASGTDVQGQDVTIWVEVQTTDGWVAIDPKEFIPPRDKVPDTPPPHPNDTDTPVTDIPPAKPQLPPDDQPAIDPNAQVGQTADGKEDVVPTPWWYAVVLWTGVGVGGLGLLVGLLVGAKAVRTAWRHRRGTPVRRIAGGWADAMDRVRDLGGTVPRKATRLEQAAALGLPPLTKLAESTNRAMFQAQPPDREIVDGYWADVKSVKSHLLAGRGRWARWWALITPKSLLVRH